MSEQREALAEVLAKHRFMPCSETTPTVAVWWAQCEGCDWKGPRRSQRHSHEGDHRAHVVDALARLLADAEQRGAERVAAAVEAVALNLDRGDSIDRGIATDLRAALTPGAADRVRAEGVGDRG